MAIAALWMGVVIHRLRIGSAAVGAQLKGSLERLRQEWRDD
jgi:hypothetical protein